LERSVKILENRGHKVYEIENVGFGTQNNATSRVFEPQNAKKAASFEEEPRRGIIAKL
jgi:hypothetical protein